MDLEPHTPCYVGRALDCAIRTDDAMVSRKHSMIRMEGGGYWVEDLGSSNGTLVNDQRVSKQQLKHNDVVRCGSLWLRYIEEGPLQSAAASASPFKAPGASPGGMAGASSAAASGFGGGHSGFAGAGASPPGIPGRNGGGAPPDLGPGPSKGGGTMRLDGPPKLSEPAAASPAIPSSRPPVRKPSGFGPPSMPPGKSPFGAPPSMPGGPGGPGGGLGASPNPAKARGNPFGSPPALPSDNPFGAPPSMPNASGLLDEPGGGSGNPFQRPGGEQNVVVDIHDGVAVQAKGDLQKVRANLDDLQGKYDREVADGKRLRAESQTLRDRIEELGETIKDRDEQVKAHARVAEELRDELTQTKADLAQTREQMADLSGDMQAKERQINRGQDDIGKLKDDIEELGRQLAEVSKTKDEGWKKLNEQLSEIEHLREVINEQERMLEERRVGLISQEEVIKELRADKERQIKSFAQLKAERDELVGNDSRRSAQLQAIDEENRRLSRLLVDMQKGGGSSGEQTATLVEDLKQARIEVKKLESDRDRYQEMYERADFEVQRLEGRQAQLEVELRDALDRSAKASSSSNVVEESLAKAEVARAKAAEEALDSIKTRDEAVAEAERAKREADRLRRRIETLETAIGSGGSQGDTDELHDQNEALQRRLRVAQDRTADLERSLRSVQAELDAARKDVQSMEARARDAEAASSSGAPAAAPAPAGGGDELVAAIRDRAMDVYEEVNDILSEIRNNVRLISGEFADMTRGSSEDSVRIISDTIQTLIDSAEDAKGIVRALRELAEFG